MTKSIQLTLAGVFGALLAVAVMLSPAAIAQVKQFNRVRLGFEETAGDENAIGVADTVGLPIRAARPKSPTIVRKILVTEADEFDLCVVSGALECNLLNSTGQDLCLKITTTDPTCATIVIDCAADTDLFKVPDGSPFPHVLAVGETLCGRLPSAPDAGGAVYSTEVQP